jgi:hypothetical protein
MVLEKVSRNGWLQFSTPNSRSHSGDETLDWETLPLVEASSSAADRVLRTVTECGCGWPYGRSR